MYAKQTVDRITRRSAQIAGPPYSGRMVPEYENEEVRELIEKPYRIIYRIKQDQIDVIAVVHDSRLLLDGMLMESYLKRLKHSWPLFLQFRNSAVGLSCR